MRRLVLLLAWGWMTMVCDLCGCCRFHTPILSSDMFSLCMVFCRGMYVKAKWENLSNAAYPVT